MLIKLIIIIISALPHFFFAQNFINLCLSDFWQNRPRIPWSYRYLSSAWLSVSICLLRNSPKTAKMNGIESINFIVTADTNWISSTNSNQILNIREKKYPINFNIIRSWPLICLYVYVFLNGIAGQMTPNE